MKCKRVMEILSAMKKREDIHLDGPEIDEMKASGLISLYTKYGSDTELKAEIEHANVDFNGASYDVRTINKELYGFEAQLNQLSLGARFGAKFGIGAGGIIKTKITDHKKRLHDKETQLSIVKNRLLTLNTELNNFNTAVRINGEKATLTPLGETMIDELTGRKRFNETDFSVVIQQMQRLDDVYLSLLREIETVMQRKNMPPIWGPFLVNSGLQNMASVIDNQYLSEYDDNVEANAMRYFQAQITQVRQNARQSPEIDQFCTEFYGKVINRQYQGQSLRQLIKDLFLIHGYGLVKTGEVIEQLGIQLEQLDVAVGKAVVSNIYTVIKAIRNSPELLRALGPVSTAEAQEKDNNVNAILILAFARRIDRFPYFLDKMQKMSFGNDIFAALATAFPWEAEETWMVLLRAESNILKTQSAQFFPEIMEYAILMTLNPRIFEIQGNLTPSEINLWRLVVTPMLLRMMLTFIEPEIEKYIATRPLAYVTRPHYYYMYHRGIYRGGRSSMHHSMHYHTVG